MNPCMHIDTEQNTPDEQSVEQVEDITQSLSCDLAAEELSEQRWWTDHSEEAVDTSIAGVQ